ncbi:MAG: hypothetical protein M1818_002688 [Claussenomyces sp. TS43310]|nr:MAG: hypothetical protein M1818_002688 [Claussenomyces sp. TS43310]
MEQAESSEPYNGAPATEVGAECSARLKIDEPSFGEKIHDKIHSKGPSTPDLASGDTQNDCRQFIVSKGDDDAQGNGNAPTTNEAEHRPQKPKPSGKRKYAEVTESSNITANMTSNLFKDALNNETRQKPANITDTQKQKALASSVRSAPEEMWRAAVADKKEIDAATKVFGSGRKQIHADGHGHWVVKGMPPSSALHNHQLLAAAFMVKRETGDAQPRGGLLASEMGLGKTVITIAAMLRNPPKPEEQKPTLIVTTTALVEQWGEELTTHLNQEPPIRSVIYRAKSRLSLPVLRFMNYIVTTYQEIGRLGDLHAIEFHRIVIDDDKKSQLANLVGLQVHQGDTSLGPVSNPRVDEVYAFFRYLQVPQTGEFREFKISYCGPSDLCNERLQVILKKIMHRQTHRDMIFGAKLIDLPPTHQKIIWIEFGAIEREVYEIFLERFVDDINESVRSKKLNVSEKKKNILQKLTVLRQLTAHILLVEKGYHGLLSPPDLVKFRTIAAAEAKLGNRMDDIVERLESLSNQLPPSLDKNCEGGRVDDDSCGKCQESAEQPCAANCGHTFCYDCLLLMTDGRARDIQNATCPVCKAQIKDFKPVHGQERSESPAPKSSHNSSRRPGKLFSWEKISGKPLPSLKTNALKAQIAKWKQESPHEKIIIFTQWLGMITIISDICVQEKWGARKYCGTMTSDARNKAIDAFKDNPEITILIASLKSGGLGLNLTVANRMISLDPWWNDCAESQAFGRVYRLGQTKDTHIVRWDEESLMSLFGTVFKDKEGGISIAGRR